MNDYYKIAEAVARVLGAEDKPAITPDGMKNTVFTIAFRTKAGADMTARLTGDRFTWRITMPRNMFAAMPFERFISKLEYELEQVFMRNIKIAAIDEVSGYQITLTL
ncbi:MAG TPA: hypothetical protein PKM65_02210 [Spirochaetota bacterium]|nr:hypothetical protein [Spirochaetota bacterium]HNT12665.1 hypothetical protein [Spirochaetota bacterium]